MLQATIPIRDRTLLCYFALIWCQLLFFLDGCIQLIVFYVYFQIFVLNYSMERAYTPFLGKCIEQKITFLLHIFILRSLND